MARWVIPAIEAMVVKGLEFDVIDAHYFYPDGVAAVALGVHFGKPVVITARGSDINLLPNYRGPRRQILAAANQAAAIISVSSALRDEMIAIGVDGGRVEVVRNGVDTGVFAPLDREATREKLGHDGPILLSVGHLVEAKGHHLAIRALPMLPTAKLVIIGEGPMERELKDLTESLGVAPRVMFIGNSSQERLRRYYTAADILVLATLREGMPNVVLEALACGTPVVATAVGGIPEIVTQPCAGRLMSARTPAAIADAVQKVLSSQIDRATVRAYAEDFGWAESTSRQLELFRRVTHRGVAAGEIEARHARAHWPSKGTGQS
ncbi:group 1 glycosyl transferase [Salinisphaera dokdonensis CL-ES53]|uniref:Group 1 glycosyl transferase n=2 Tax=Salinisphaera TaxID=180541 RepID=A0ABV2B4Y1_9GAMM